MEPVSEFFANIANILLLPKKRDEIICELKATHEKLKTLKEEHENTIKELQNPDIDENRKNKLLFILEATNIGISSIEERKYSKREMFEEMVKMLK